MQEKEKHTTISISTSTMIRAVLVLIGFALIYILRDIVLVILTSIVIASFVESAANRLKKYGIGRIFAVVSMYIFSILLLAGIFYLFAPLLITEIYNASSILSHYFPDSNFINSLHGDTFSGAKDIVTNLTQNFSLSGLLTTSQNFISNLSAGFFQTLSSAFGSIFNVLMIVIISFYLSTQEHGIENFLHIVVPPKHEVYAIDLWQRSRHKIALWIKGQMLLGLIIGVMVYLVLSLLGLQFAFIMAILTAVMELIPFGMLIAMIPAVAFAYISGGLTMAIMVGGAYLIIHQFEVYLLSPLIVKRVVGLSPLVVVLSILIGYDLAGVWGLILAIPVAVVIMEFMNDIEKSKIFQRTSNETN